MSNEKYGLVISGGGAKGAFAVGALEYLRNSGQLPPFDIIVGTSTGALIAPLVATRDINSLVRLYLNMETKYFGSTNTLMQLLIGKANGYFDTTPLRDLISKNLDQNVFQSLLRGNKQIAIVTVNVQTSSTSVFQMGKPLVTSSPNLLPIPIGDLETFQDAILASASEPVWTPPVEVQKGYQFVDGGVKELLALNLAIENGCTNIIAIPLSVKTPIPDPTKVTDFFGMIKRSFDLFCDDVYENDRRIADIHIQTVNFLFHLREQIKQSWHKTDSDVQELYDSLQVKCPFPELMSKVKVDYVEPTSDLLEDGLKFTPQDMATLMTKGYDAAKMVFPSNFPIKDESYFLGF